MKSIFSTMKNLFVLSFISLFFFNQAGYASEPGDFSLDMKSMEREFSELSSLETMVIHSGYLSFSDLQNQSKLPANFSDMNLSEVSFGEDPMGIPGFWWGCILGPVGILLAYVLSDNDKDQARKALNGCIVTGAVEVVGMVAYFIWISTFYVVY